MQYWMHAATEGLSMKCGEQILNEGAGHNCPPLATALLRSLQKRYEWTCVVARWISHCLCFWTPRSQLHSEFASIGSR